MSVDTMDLLIAAAAVLEEAPLVTRNTRHFAKVPGLRVVGY
jgi:predicted nucleic acid-binding protein